MNMNLLKTITENAPNKSGREYKLPAILTQRIINLKLLIILKGK